MSKNFKFNIYKKRWAGDIVLSLNFGSDYKKFNLKNMPPPLRMHVIGVKVRKCLTGGGRAPDVFHFIGYVIIGMTPTDPE